MKVFLRNCKRRMKVLENLKLENIKSTKDHIKYENY